MGKFSFERDFFKAFQCERNLKHGTKNRKGVAITGRNKLHYWPTVQCYHGAIIRLEAALHYCLACTWPARVKPPAGPPKTTKTDARGQNNTAPYTV